MGRRPGWWVVAALAAVASCGGDAGDTDPVAAPASALTVPAPARPEPSALPTAGATTAGAAAATTTITTTTTSSSGSADAPPSTAGPDGPVAACASGEAPALSAFDAASGDEHWMTCAPADLLQDLLAADDERAYLLEQPPLSRQPPALPAFFAVDVDTGSVVWRYEPSAWASIPPGEAVASGVMVLGLSGQDGTDVVAIDAATGTERWRIPLGREGILTATSEAGVIVERSLSPDERPTVVTADASGRFPPPTLTTRLTGYDRATGDPLWTSDVSRPSPSTSGERGNSFGAASDGTTIVVALPAVVALDEATGAQRWTLTADLGDAAIGQAADGVLIMGGQDDETTALALDTGEVLWTRPGSPPYDNVWAVADGAVYLRDDHDLIAYQLHDGAERWRVPVDPATYTWPWLAEDQTLYTMWWNLEARATSDGHVDWTTDHPTGAMPTDDTRRMVGAVSAGSSMVVAYTSGAGPGD